MPSVLSANIGQGAGIEVQRQIGWEMEKRERRQGVGYKLIARGLYLPSHLAVFTTGVGVV
jgi:hypothetical protein